MSGDSPQRSGGGAARDREPSDHGDDPDLQRAHTRTEGPEAAEHGGGAAPPTVAASRGAPRRRACKISAEDARAIFQAKSLRDDGVARALGREYGITAKAVRDIWTGRTWARETRCTTGASPRNAGTGGEKVGAGVVCGAWASRTPGHHAAAHGESEHFHLLPSRSPNSLLGGLTGAGATGLDGNPVQDASAAISFRPTPAAHTEGAIGGGRDHWRTGLSRSLGALDEVRKTADTNEQADVWAVPMRQNSWPLLGHAQGHRGTAGNRIGKADPALGHHAAAHCGGGSSFTPAPLSQAQYAAAAPAMQQQNWGPRIHNLPAPTANNLAPSHVGGGEMVDFCSGRRAHPSSAQASVSLTNPTNMMRTAGPFGDWVQGLSPSARPRDGADEKMMDRPRRSPGPVDNQDPRQYASDCLSFWEDKSIGGNAMDEAAAPVNLVPFTFERALRSLSDCPLPHDFQPF